MSENPVSKEPTIPSIDDALSRLTGRLNGLKEHLRSATFGEQPVSEDSCEKESIPSSSLESINRRLTDAHELVDSLERFIQRFHN